MVDFRNLVFDPKIDIVGKEVPLAAIAQTGEVLQNKYDKSYENETKTQALIRKLQQSVDPADQELATQIGQTYSQRLADRAARGDYHNMRWQTLQDAQEFSDIYTGLAERNKKLQTYSDAINTYKGINDPSQRAYELQKWKASQSKAQFDPENRFLTGLGVTAPQLVDDVDMAKWVDTYGKNFEADVIGQSNGRERFYKAGDKLPNGEVVTIPGIYDIKSAKKTRNVKAADIEKVLGKYAKGDPQVQAFKNAKLDFYINGQGLTPEQAEARFNRDFQDGLIKSAANKYGFTESIMETDANYDAPSSAMLKAMGTQTSQEWGVPVNTVADNYGIKEDKSLRSTLVDFTRGNVGDFHNMLSFVNSNINDAKDAKTKEQYQGLKDALKELQQLTPEEQKAVASYFEGSLLSAGWAALKDPKAKAVTEKLNKYIGHALSLDNSIEDNYQNYTKSNKGFQNINLVVPHYKNAETIRDLQTWMKSSLDAGDFKAFKGEIDPAADYSFSKISDRPLGNGTGVVIELKNNKDNSTILVEPKDARMLDALETTFPGVSSMNMFKNTSDFNNNEVRAIKDIFKENNLSPKNVPTELENSKIMYSGGMYYLLNSQGAPVIINGQPKVATSYLDLF